MSQPALRKPLKKVYYISAVPRGNIRHLSRAERVDVYTGQLAVDWAQITREDIETFMPYYRRKNSPAMLTLLPSMAEKVLSSYIRYYVASLNHGTAIAAAPRRTGELSQAVALENVPFFGMFSTEEVVPTETDFTQTELQRINAIVRDNAEVAARLGLTESGDNKGPKVDEAKARAAIAASPDAIYFQSGYLPMGNVPGAASSSAAASASSSMPAMGSAAGPSSSSALALMPAMGSASAAASAPAPAPAPAPTSASARGRGASRGRGAAASRGSSAAGRKRGRGALNSIAEGENGAEQGNGNNSASQAPNNGAGNGSGNASGSASGSAAGVGGRRRRMRRRSTKRKTRRSHKKTRRHA